MIFIAIKSVYPIIIYKENLSQQTHRRPLIHNIITILHFKSTIMTLEVSQYIIHITVRWMISSSPLDRQNSFRELQKIIMSHHVIHLTLQSQPIKVNSLLNVVVQCISHCRGLFNNDGSVYRVVTKSITFDVAISD